MNTELAVTILKKHWVGKVRVLTLGWFYIRVRIVDVEYWPTHNSFAFRVEWFTPFVFKETPWSLGVTMEYFRDLDRWVYRYFHRHIDMSFERRHND